MTTTSRWMTVVTSDLPLNPALRREAQAMGEKGQPTQTHVFGPPPTQGRAAASAVETLVVGARAAQVHGGKVVWGAWDAARNQIRLDDGGTMDLAGRRAVEKE